MRWRNSSDAEVNRRTRLMVTSDTPGARIAVDGAPAVVSPLIREVEPGQHKVAVTADGFFPEQRSITAVRGELIPESVSLKERPSTLMIWAPEGAELYLDGVFASRGGDHIVLELPGGTHRLTAIEKGRRVFVRTLELERGASREVRVALPPTRQRQASTILFWSGAGALVTAVGAGALAVAFEQRAQEFLTLQAEGNVTGADLARYHEDRTYRAEARLVAGISLAASAGLFVTAAFLYELDRPSSEWTRPGAERVSLRLAPMALPGGGGAAMHLTF